MQAKVVKVLTTYILETTDGKKAKTNIDHSYRNAVNWIGIERGDVVRQLKWKSEESGIIDGDSPVERV